MLNLRLLAVSVLGIFRMFVRYFITSVQYSMNRCEERVFVSVL